MDIKKILTATINHDHPQRGMTHAFEGIFGKENVVDFDYVKMRERNSGRIQAVNDLFVERAKSWKPDWIWMQLQMTNTLQAEAIRRVRQELPQCVISHWMGDCRAEVSPYLASICEATHLTLVSNIGQIGMFREAGAERVEYCQIGLDWEEDVCGIPDWTPPFKVPEVVLVGNHYGVAFPGTKDREDAIRALWDAKIDAGVVGGGWPLWAKAVGKCHVKQQHHVWKRAKVALNVNHFNDIDLFYSDRQLISMASGTPVVCYAVPRIDEEFTDGVHCLFYRTKEELVDRVKKLLSDPSYARFVGISGRNEVIRSHTWFSRILRVLGTIEKIRHSLG